MSTTAFESIKQGLMEAIEHAEISASTEEVTLWIDTDVLEKYKAFGDDWQTRINDVLRAHG